MADRIITVTNPSVVTNDTLSGYNNYSDIDGQLGTTMTPTEATNGKTVTLSDGVVHEVTTKPVGTTNGEFSAVVSDAVTVDLTAPLFGIKTSGAAANASSLSQANSPATPTNFEFKLNVNDLIDMDFSTPKWFITNNRASNVNGFWGFQTTTIQNEIVFKIWDDVGGTDGTPFAIAEGDELKLIKTDEVFTVFVNGGLVDTVQGAGTFLLIATRLVLGARQVGTQQTNFSFYNLAFVTETWDFEEQTGITATGSLGTVLDLDIGTGTAGDMWITI